MSLLILLQSQPFAQFLHNAIVQIAVHIINRYDNRAIAVIDIQSIKVSAIASARLRNHCVIGVVRNEEIPFTLRHSYLTYAVGKTSDYKTIQGISGHSDVFTLMNRYAHPQEEKKIELSEEMSKILSEM